jgi:hypothetical protein
LFFFVGLLDFWRAFWTFGGLFEIFGGLFEKEVVDPAATMAVVERCDEGFAKVRKQQSRSGERGLRLITCCYKR